MRIRILLASVLAFPLSATASWYAPNSAFTDCKIDGGPAALIDSFRGTTTQYDTQDHKRSGQIWKVEVNEYTGGGRYYVYTFYRSKSDCMAEQVNRYQRDADRYR
jgi:hypothetical protein